MVADFSNLTTPHPTLTTDNGVTLATENHVVGPTSALRATFAANRGQQITSLNVDDGAILMQDWVTAFAADGDVEEVIMHSSKWLRNLDVSSYAIQVDLPQISNCDLLLETAATPEGPWFESTKLDSPGYEDALLSSEGGGDTLLNLVRWRITPTGGDWIICFRMKAIPQQTVRLGVGRRTR